MAKTIYRRIVCWGLVLALGTFSLVVAQQGQLWQPSSAWAQTTEPVYLLQDEFLTNRAAGAVDGTLAEPGPGVRTVIDTENRVSISNGKLTFSGGLAAPIWGDPVVFYPSCSRQVGQIFTWQINVAEAAGKEAEFGLSPDLPALNIAHAIYLADGNINITNNNKVYWNLGTFTAGVDYYFAIVLQGTGALYFVKGGAYPDWTLIGYFIDGEANSFNPYLASYNMALSARFIRAPEALGPSPVLGPNLMAGLDPGLEANYTDGKCDTLAKYGSPVLAQSADAHSGSKAQQFQGTGLNDNVYWPTTIIPTPHTGYRYSIWAKRLSGSAGTTKGGVYQNFTWVTSPCTEEAYTEKVATFCSPDSTPLYVSAVTETGAGPFDTVVVDDASLQAINTDDLTALLNQFIQPYPGKTGLPWLFLLLNE